MLERERIIEIVVAISSVLLMIGVMIGIGMTYGTGGSILPEEGAEILVWAIIGFIFLMTIVGIALAFALNEPEDGLDSAEDAQSTA